MGKSRRPKQPSVRVIAGQFKGRRLAYPPGRVVRPTMDRTREALFSALQERIPGVGFADLFCAAGGVGIEALSRGASIVEFVERHHRSLGLLRENLEACGVESDRFRVHPTDVFRYLERGGLDNPDVKIAFADPPYDGDYSSRLLAHFDERSYDGLELFVLEHREPIENRDAGRLKFSRTKRFGDSQLSFWVRS